MKFTETTAIDAPPELVWSIVADFPAVASYSPAVRTSTATTDHRSGVGAGRYLRLQPFGFGSLTEKVTEWHEGSSYRFDIVDSSGLPPFDGATAVVRIEPAAGSSCRATLEMEYRFAGPLGRFFEQVLPGPIFRRGLRRYLSGLKAYAESLARQDGPSAQSRPGT